MLLKKMLRDLKHNKMQFFSMFILAMLAIYLYSGFASEIAGVKNARNNYHSACNTADGWILGEKFSKNDLLNVEKIDGITEAQGRIMQSAVGMNDSDLQVYFMDDNNINKPYIMEGEEFDCNDDKCLWISYRYAKENNLSIGDKYTFNIGNEEFTLNIAGLVWSSEYEYYKETSDIEPNYSKTGYIFCSAKLFGDSSYNQIVFTSNVDNVYTLENQLNSILSYTTFSDKDSQDGISALNSEMEQHKVMSDVFPVAFMLTALLSIVTTMTRLVNKQRTEIGTLKALGMKENKIIHHYLSYSFFLSLAGVILGGILGPLTISPFLFNMKYRINTSTEYLLPTVDVNFPPSFIVLGIIIVFICSLSTYLCCKNILKLKPAETLRPAAPKVVKKSIFEKLPFWNKLGFSVQYNLRDLSRNKVRTIMGLIGTIGCMALLICGFMCKESFSAIPDWYFGKINNYTTQIRFNSAVDLDEAEKVRKDVNGGMWMEQSIEIKGKDGVNKFTSTLDAIDGEGFFRITDENQTIIPFGDGDFALSRNLAQSMGISEGDSIMWHLCDSNKWVTSKVTIIHSIPMGKALIMTRKTLEDSGYEFKPSGVMTDENITKYDSPNTAYVYGIEDLKGAADAAIEMANMIVIIMVTLACILAIVVLHNMGLLSYTERQKELATLKVIGFRTSQLRKLLLKQNLWLAVIGSIIGTPIGMFLLQLLLDSQGDSFDLSVKFDSMSFIISFIITVGISCLVSIIFSRKLKKINMVENLKGTE